MTKLYAAILLALLPSLAVAGPPKVPAVVTLRVGEITSVEIKADAGKEVAWQPGFAAEACFVDEGKAFSKDTCRLIVSPKQAGVYRVVLWTVGEGREGSAVLVIDAGGSPPVPPGPGPTPPAPDPPKPDPPKPDPPKPDPPQPEPAPIPVAGFRVLVVYETADLGKLTPGQRAIFSSRDVRDYLNATCVKGQDGRTPEWRIYDKDTDMANESKVWRDAMTRALARATALPWCIVSNGKTGYEGPLPRTLQEAIDLLKKYGG